MNDECGPSGVSAFSVLPPLRRRRRRLTRAPLSVAARSWCTTACSMPRVSSTIETVGAVLGQHHVGSFLHIITW